MKHWREEFFDKFIKNKESNDIVFNNFINLFEPTLRNRLAHSNYFLDGYQSIDFTIFNKELSKVHTETVNFKSIMTNFINIMAHYQALIKSLSNFCIKSVESERLVFPFSFKERNGYSTTKIRVIEISPNRELHTLLDPRHIITKPLN